MLRQVPILQPQSQLNRINVISLSPKENALHETHIARSGLLQHLGHNATLY